MGNNKLPGGVDGVGGKIKGGRVQTVPGRECGVGLPGTEMVEGELGGGKKIRLAIRGKGNVAGRQGGKEVVLPCADSPFCAVSAMVLGGNILALDGRLRGAEKSGEFGRGLIIQLDVSDGTGMRREEGTGRAKRMDIRGGGARLEGNEMNIVAVKQDKNILETVVR